MTNQEYQIVVISLRRSFNRRNQVSKELNKTNLNWSFIDAVDGSLFQQYPKEYKSGKVLRLQGFSLTKSEIGCYLSHIEAWKFCYLTNKITVVFEDDFVLADEFSEHMDLLIGNKNLWELIRLQSLYKVDQKIVNDLGKIKIAKNLGDPVGATAYVVKPSAAKILLSSSKDIYEPVDHFLEHKRKHGLEMLALYPYIVRNSGTETTICDRPIRHPIKGFKKVKRSIFRALDRTLSHSPWFP